MSEPIPDGAVEAAARALFAVDYPGEAWPSDGPYLARYYSQARAGLSAALPHMREAVARETTEWLRSEVTRQTADPFTVAYAPAFGMVADLIELRFSGDPR